MCGMNIGGCEGESKGGIPCQLNTSGCEGASKGSPAQPTSSSDKEDFTTLVREIERRGVSTEQLGLFMRDPKNLERLANFISVHCTQTMIIDGTLLRLLWLAKPDGGEVPISESERMICGVGLIPATTKELEEFVDQYPHYLSFDHYITSPGTYNPDGGSRKYVMFCRELLRAEEYSTTHWYLAREK